MQPTLHFCRSKEGQGLSAFGIEIVHNMGSAQTGKQWSLLQYTAPPNLDGPPPHYHKILQETFYVLKGSQTLLAADQTLEASAGTTIAVPTLMVPKF